MQGRKRGGLHRAQALLVDDVKADQAVQRAIVQLDVERDVPIHGRVLPIAEVRAKLAEQTRNAELLCARVEGAGLSMPGCPLAWDD